MEAAGAETSRLSWRPDALALGVLATIGVAVVAAWVISSDQMAGMDAGPGTDPGSLGFFVGVWTVMMAAMMFPSAAPMVLIHARMIQGRRARGEPVARSATAFFIGGYLLAWAVAGIAGFGIYLLGRAATGELFAWEHGGPYLAGGIVLAAAIYQLTPLKDVCLRHCRSPLVFVLEHWRSGRIGGLRMGANHGGWCIGCCWALMATLFALGVMSLAWMALIAVLIAIEKLVPWKTVANRGIALVLVVLGLSLMLVPADVPGLTVPGSPQATSTMQGMDSGGSNSTSATRAP